MAFRVDGVSASYPQRRRSYATVVTEWASWVPAVSVVCLGVSYILWLSIATVAGRTGTGSDFREAT